MLTLTENASTIVRVITSQTKGWRPSYDVTSGRDLRVPAALACPWRRGDRAGSGVAPTPSGSR